MPLETNTPALSAPKSRSTRLKKWAWRSLGATLLIITIVFGALIWPGWPLHWLARLPIEKEARKLGCAITMPDLWLRLHTDGILRLSASRFKVGDAAEPAAIQLNNVELSWSLTELLGARALPASLSLGSVELRPSMGPDGSPRLAGLPNPAVETNTAKPAKPTALQPALPVWLQPAVDHPFVATLGSLKVFAPPGGSVPDILGGPARLEWSAQADGSSNLSAQLPLAAAGTSAVFDLAAAGRITPASLDHAALKVTFSQANGQAPTTLDLNLTAPAGAPLHAKLTVAKLMPGDWLRFIPDREKLPVLQGGLDLSLEADYELKSAKLVSLSGNLRTDAWKVTPPAGTGLPDLPLAPLSLSWQISDHGREGKISPFELSAGPLHLSSTGLAWQTDAQANLTGSGELRLAELHFATLLPWLPVTLLPPEHAWISEVATQVTLSPATIKLSGGGPATNGLPGLKVDLAGGLNLRDSHIDFNLLGDFKPAEGVLDLTVRVPKFNQARWQIAALQNLGIPDLDTPLEAEASLRLRWPDKTVERANWKIAAGPGLIVPHGPARRWLARPFPLTSFAVSGRMEDNLRNLSLDRLEFSSGRMNFSAGRSELLISSPQPGGEPSHTMRMSFAINDAYAADFLPLLAAPLLETLAPLRTDLEALGIETLRATADVTFAKLPWIDPRPKALSATQEAVLRVGPERIPFNVEWRNDPASERITAEASVAGLRVDRLPLPSLRNSPVSAAVLDLPISVSLALSANPFAANPADFAPAVTVELKAGPGRVRANPYLATDLPVAAFNIATTARLLPLRFEQVRLHADFQGPTVDLSDTLLQPDRLGPSRMTLELKSFPLDWVASLVPVPLWPHPILAQARKSGSLDHARVQASWQPAAASNPATSPGSQPPRFPWQPDQLTLDCLLNKPMLAPPDLPPVQADRIAIKGDLAAVTLQVRGAATDGVLLPELDARWESPLATPGRLVLSGQANIALDRLPPLLKSIGSKIQLPPTPDLAGLSGTARFDFNAQTPWPSASDGSELQADLTAQLTAVTLPLSMRPPETTLSLGATDLSAKVRIAKLEAQGEVEVRPASIHLPPWFKGAPVINSTFTATPKLITTQSTIDLQAAQLSLVPLSWNKPDTRPASLLAKTTFEPAVDRRPARFTIEFESYSLPTPPFKLRAAGELADSNHAGLSVLPALHALDIPELRLGSTTAALGLKTAPDGIAEVSIKSAMLDLAAWVPFLPLPPPAPPAPPAKPVAKISVTAAPPPLTTLPPLSGELLPPLAIPDLRLLVAIASIRLGPQTELPDTRLEAAFLAGRPSSLALLLRTAREGTLKISLAPAPADVTKRQPVSLALTDIGDWVRTLCAPLESLPSDWAALVAPMREHRETFLGGTLEFAGTVDWATRNDPVQGKFSLRDLRLQTELEFLRKLAALVDRRVQLQVPFKIVDFPSFSVGPAGLKTGAFFVDGPLNMKGKSLIVDLVNQTMEMQGKVLAVGFEVVGPISEPQFYLSEKGMLIKGITTGNDFDW
ncbi:MAG: hypothetical protein RIQ79_872 [Verrucomicrobiota bacterium]